MSTKQSPTSSPPPDRARDRGADLQRQQVALVRVLLLGLLVTVALVVLLAYAIGGPGALSVQGLVSLAGLAALVGVALARLRRGHLSQAVGLVAAGLLLLLALETLEGGIVASSGILLVFMLPVTLAGLLLGRSVLVLVSGVSVLIVLGVRLLEQAGVPGVASDPDLLDPDLKVVVFALVVGLLSLFLDRFGSALRRAHDAAVADARELSELNEELRRQMAERRHAEEERERTEERLRLASHAAGLGVWSWDLTTREATWSNSLRELLEVPASLTPSAEAFLERVHPEDRPRVARGIEDITALGDEGRTEFRIVLPDGRVAWLDSRFRLTRSPDGRPVHMDGVLYDISDRKRVEQERLELLAREREARTTVERANKRLAFLVEASRLLATALDPQETLQRLTDLLVPEFADWCSIQLRQADGGLRRVAVAHRDSEKRTWMQELQRRYPVERTAGVVPDAVASGTTLHYPALTDADLRSLAEDEAHYRALQRFGLRSVIVVPLVHRGEALGVLNLAQEAPGEGYSDEDVQFAEEFARRAAISLANTTLYQEARTLNRELELRVHERTAQLEAANKELEAFSYSVSHDLRAPLRGIHGFSEVLMEDYGEVLDETAKEHLRRIQAGADRMRQLIDSFLELARVSRADLKKARVDLAPVASVILEELQREEPEREVVARVADRLEVWGDARMLRTVLENLLTNAWKFTSDCRPARIEVGWEEVEGVEVLIVRDNGVGFDMAHTERLFTPFQRLHTGEHFEGTGVGLATTHRIVSRHGGRVWARSAPGEGATFYLELPPPPPA